LGGLKELVDEAARLSGVPEDEVRRRLAELRGLLEKLEIPSEKREAVLATLERLLFRGGEPIVGLRKLEPREYARAVLNASERAGDRIDPDIYHEVERALVAFYELIFTDEVLKILFEPGLIARLAENLGQKLTDIENRLRVLELELPEWRVARVLEHPWGEEPPDELSFAALTARVGLVPFQEVRLSRRGAKPVAFRALLAEIQGLDPGFYPYLVVGEGGAGKTRLGFELARELEKAGWAVGALPANLNRGQLSGLGGFLEKSGQKGLFLLLDYAGERRDLDKLLVFLDGVAREVRKPVVALMLERYPKFLESVARGIVPTSNPNYEKDWQKRAEELRKKLSKLEQSPYELHELEEEDARALFHAAFRALKARYPEETARALAPEEVWEELSRGGGYPRRPLPLVLAAYLSVQGERPTSPREEALLEEALGHEREARWWRRLEQEYESEDEAAEDYPFLEVLIAGATLLGELGREEALSFLKAHYADRKVFIAAKKALPLGENHVAPLEPDPVADLFLRGLWADARQKERLKELLAEVVRRGGARPEALGARLRRADQVLRRARVGSARERMRELDGFWREVLSSSGLSASELLALFERGGLKPEAESHPLFATPLAAAALELGLPALREPAEVARYSLGLGNILHAAGLDKRALDMVEKSTMILRGLAEEKPETYLPLMAVGLNNKGVMLSALGRHEEALKATEEAVEIHRELAERNPEAYLPDLAMSLSNLGAKYSYLGRHEEALKATEEAVELYRELAARNPEAYLPDLAGSLNNLGSDLSALGRHEEALAALRVAVEALKEHFLRYPRAYGAWMRTMLANYLRKADELGHGPERELLCPLVPAFEALGEVPEELLELCEGEAS